MSVHMYCERRQNPLADTSYVRTIVAYSRIAEAAVLKQKAESEI